MWILVHWLAYTAGVFVASQVVPGITLKGRWSVLVAGGIVGVLNVLFAKLLFWAFAIATLGLAWLFGIITRWIIAAVLFKVADVATDQLEVKGVVPAIVGGGIVSLVAAIVAWILPW